MSSFRYLLPRQMGLRIEIKLAESNERISELERRPRHVAAESNRPTQNRLDGFKPDEFKEFHGALFHWIRGRYENTVFCETCKVPLENLGDNHLFKCPICRKNVEFTPNELPDFIKALNSGKAE